ncbi:MAG: RnfABCDGE type electron transport complex subunit C, partial [Defluviitaleaceae bacterium]|nr:RnfABCDGE type electron transport complex subunit C [Defluviitaleaceae bacterium]
MKKLVTFRHGVHTDDHKKETENAPIRPIIPKDGEIMTFPLIQHIGAPAVPIVQKGQRVLLGQKIAEAPTLMSSPIHASISGTIVDFTKTVTTNGSVSEAITIENDGLMEEIAFDGAEDFLKFTKDEFLEKIREAGIVGLGGAGFPTHIKLNPPREKRVDYIIVNAAECEPYLTTDYRIMVEYPKNIKRGLQIMLKIFSSSKIIIGIEANKPKAIVAMKEITKYENRISVVVLAPKYPQGSEKQLIQAVT